MNNEKTLQVEKLLPQTSSMTAREAEDFIRSIVKKPEVRFQNGTMLLTTEGARQLAESVATKTITGNHSYAKAILADMPPPPNTGLINIHGVRRLCQDVIDGKTEGNIENAKAFLAEINATYPHL